MMMRAGTEKSSTHSKKLGTDFGSLEKIPQCSSDIRYNIYFASSSHPSKVQKIYKYTL